MNRTVSSFAITTAVIALVLAARAGSRRVLRVLFSRPFASEQSDGAKRRPTVETNMTKRLHVADTYQDVSPRPAGEPSSLARTISSEYELALIAAAKAALPRRNLTELRAMYAKPAEPPEQPASTR